MDDDLDLIFERLKRSPFRRRFRLSERDGEYVASRGIAEIEAHARRFVRERLAPAAPPNDGRQTPMRGHPVFTSQHATATCCRSCIARWHGIPAGSELTDREIAYLVGVVCAWIERQEIHAHHPVDQGPTLFDDSG